MLRSSLPLLLVAAVLVPAVAAGQSTATSARPTSKASAAPRGIPAGTYTTTLSKTDLAGRVPAAQVDSLVGVWTMAFDSSGHVAVRWKGTQVVEAVAKPMSDHRVYFDDKDSGPYACHMPGTYRYTVSGDRLTLVKVSDKCDGRAAVLTAHAHKRGR